jgi:endonuclease/exonuclease/phosphatase (EEP) superfamily protein YafD
MVPHSFTLLTGLTKRCGQVPIAYLCWYEFLIPFCKARFHMQAAIAWTLTAFYLLISFLPLVRSDFWTFRILEYPRLQKLVLGLLLVVMVVLLRDHLEGAFPYLLGILLGCCFFLVIKIYPYTKAASCEMRQVPQGDKGHALRVFAANVLQTNRHFDAMLSQSRGMDPDLILLVETDAAWEKAMRPLEQKYPHTVKEPLDNTYGMLLYSRLPLRNEQVIYRVEADVPSIEAEVKLPCGVWVKIFCLHPKPPAPEESLYSTAKDKELMKVAFLAREEQKPCIVMGDLNDVAWSHVTEMFRKVSGLLDPRRGRGFYSTFSSKSWLVRFPLDYIFCSPHFGLLGMKRLPFNHSDHFAMFIHLQYDPSLKREQKAPQAEEGEKEEAAKKATEPVGAK